MQQKINVINETLTPEQLSNELAKLQKVVRFILNGNIDTENIFEVGGWRATENLLASKDGDVGFSTIDTSADDLRIWAGNINRESAPYRVYESGALYASNAELSGKITSSEIEGGTITGAHIQTDYPGIYPRVELSSSERLLMAEQSPGINLMIEAEGPDFAPSLYLNHLTDYGSLHVTSGATFHVKASNQLNLEAFADIQLIPAGDVRVPDWDRVWSNTDAQSLETILGSKVNRDFYLTDNAGSHSHGVTVIGVGDHNHGIPSGTVLQTAGGGTVTFVSSGGHTHSASTDTAGDHFHGLSQLM
ncbi:hypothetical protein AB6A23_11210 [Paenibacillus tarimensis]